MRASITIERCTHARTKKQGHSTFLDHLGLRVSGEGVVRRGRDQTATHQEIQNVPVLFLMSGKGDSKVFRFSKMDICSRLSAMCFAIRFASDWSSMRWTGLGNKERGHSTFSGRAGLWRGGSEESAGRTSKGLGKTKGLGVISKSHVDFDPSQRSSFSLP